MPLLDTKTVSVATVVAPEAKAEIRNIRYWNPVTAAWVTTPPTNVPFGASVGACADMANTGTSSQAMYLRFILRRPNGTTKSSYTYTAVTVAPGGVFTGYAGYWDAADMAGTWTMVIELHGEVV